VDCLVKGVIGCWDVLGMEEVLLVPRWTIRASVAVRYPDPHPTSNIFSSFSMLFAPLPLFDNWDFFFVIVAEALTRYGIITSST